MDLDEDELKATKELHKKRNKHFLRCNTCNKLILSISAYDYHGKPICMKCYRQVIDKFIEVLKGDKNE